MTYIVLLIFISLLVMPLVYLKKDPKIFDNNYNVEYHFGLTSPAIKEKSRKSLKSDESSAPFINETGGSMDDMLKFEGWMTEPLEWEVDQNR